MGYIGGYLGLELVVCDQDGVGASPDQQAISSGGGGGVTTQGGCCGSKDGSSVCSGPGILGGLGHLDVEHVEKLFEKGVGRAGGYGAEEAA